MKVSKELMTNGYFEPFSRTTASTGVNVLTLAAAFPSLIQPWLVNHLVQIALLGGDNRVISRKEEKGNLTDAIAEHALDKKYCCVPTNKIELIQFYIRSMKNKSVREHQRELWANYDSKGTSLKERVVDRLVSPAFTTNPDIIHSHTELVGSHLVRLIRASQKPFVITFHGLPPVGVPLVSDFARRQYTDAADAIFMNTEFAKQQYVSLGAPEDKCIVVPQGIDLDNWPFETRKFPVDGPVNILTVGRLHPDKGHQFALTAIKQLLEKGQKVTYTMVGSGPEKDKILRVSKELGISDAVAVLSGIPDKQLKEVYQKSHVFLLPSLRSKDGFHEETQGVVLQEAQATGIITIATKSGGIPECIDDGESGFLVEDRDSQAIAAAVMQVIEKRACWESIQTKARKWVEERYASDKIASFMNQQYRSIIEEHQRRNS